MFNGVKVFSATTSGARETLGERLTTWQRTNPKVTVDEVRVVQSSDDAFHCLTMVVFYTEVRQ